MVCQRYYSLHPMGRSGCQDSSNTTLMLMVLQQRQAALGIIFFSCSSCSRLVCLISRSTGGGTPYGPDRFSLFTSTTSFPKAYGMWSLIKHAGPRGKQYASLAPSMMMSFAANVLASGNYYGSRNALFDDISTKPRQRDRLHLMLSLALLCTTMQ